MAELGIDTASQDIAVAILDGERVLAERRWRLETTASRELLAGIEAVLRDAGIDRNAIEAIAVDIGPGAYTGLRSGVATAQGLALGLGIPLAGVARLEADAFPHLAPGVPVVAVHAAGRSGIAWAAYVPCDAPEAVRRSRCPHRALTAPRTARASPPRTRSGVAKSRTSYARLARRPDGQATQTPRTARMGAAPPTSFGWRGCTARTRIPRQSTLSTCGPRRSRCGPTAASGR